MYSENARSKIAIVGNEYGIEKKMECREDKT